MKETEENKFITASNLVMKTIKLYKRNMKNPVHGKSTRLH